MEVHAHTHTARKKWTHYLFEFLMLFLAVFCGFLAEYQLEHVIENQREKKYMQSLVEDLKRDTADINFSIPAKETRIKAIDSVLQFFKKNGLIEKVPGYIIYNMVRSGFDQVNERNRGTIDQLKNAGGLRLIRKQTVLDSIKQFDHDWEAASIWRESYVTRFREHSSYLEKMFSAPELLSLYTESNNLVESRNIPFVKINTEHLGAYITHLWGQRRTVASDLRNHKKISEKATMLIILIKKEYDLK